MDVFAFLVTVKAVIAEMGDAASPLKMNADDVAIVGLNTKHRSEPWHASVDCRHAAGTFHVQYTVHSVHVYVHT